MYLIMYICTKDPKLFYCLWLDICVGVSVQRPIAGLEKVTWRRMASPRTSRRHPVHDKQTIDHVSKSYITCVRVT